ncbi:MAG: DUF1587 domain-containing protein, partial [Myxococcota bacterium]
MGRSLLALLALFASCSPDDGGGGPPRGAEPAVAPAPAQLRRLTDAEYRNTLRDLFGEALVLPVALEPDLEVDGLVAEGAAQAAVSPLGVERYEDAAYLVGEQVAADRARWSGCAPAGAVDDACAEAVLRPLARMAWRRAPTDPEVTTLVSIAR